MRITKALVLLGVLVSLAAPASAQDGRTWDPTGLQLTREELKELLVRFESTANSEAYSETMRESAKSEAAIIRQRLELGDIRAGDRINLRVEGHQSLTNVFEVDGNVAVVLPDLGPVSLVGVLRSELQDHMTNFIKRFIRDPRVYAKSAIRIELRGEVGNPGYHVVASDMPITDVIMTTGGGPSGNADPNRVKIIRGNETIWDGERMREAVNEGRTLDQLSVRAGDAIEVQAKRGKFSPRNLLWGSGSIMSLLFLINRLDRIGVF